MPRPDHLIYGPDEIARANLRGLCFWLMRFAMEAMLLALIWILINILLFLALKNR